MWKKEVIRWQLKGNQMTIKQTKIEKNIKCNQMTIKR